MECGTHLDIDDSVGITQILRLHGLHAVDIQANMGRKRIESRAGDSRQIELHRHRLGARAAQGSARVLIDRKQPERLRTRAHHGQIRGERKRQAAAAEKGPYCELYIAVEVHDVVGVEGRDVAGVFLPDLHQSLPLVARGDDVVVVGQDQASRLVDRRGADVDRFEAQAGVDAAHELVRRRERDRHGLRWRLVRGCYYKNRKQCHEQQ